MSRQAVLDDSWLFAQATAKSGIMGWADNDPYQCRLDAGSLRRNDFALKHILDRIESLSGPQDLITVSGRADENESWLKLRANIYQRPLALLGSMEPTALGAMILAVVGIGTFNNLDEAVHSIANIERVLAQEKELALVYRRAYELYSRAQDAMHTYWQAAGRNAVDNN